MKNASKMTVAAISFFLFVALIAGLRSYDVAPVGDAPEIGFSHINAAIHDFFGVNIFWYELTEVLGYVAIAIVALSAVAGLLQLIKRKSLLEVDRELYALAGVYVALGALYVAFEKIVINYRPIILPDENDYEASFPSSHTMLACVVFGCVIIMSHIYLENDIKSLGLRIIMSILIFLAVFGRLICGVHWFTDILGGVLISITLVYLFDAITGLWQE